MAITLLIALLAVIGYFVLQRRLADRFTDRVTKRNRATLGRYLLLLFMGFVLLMLWISCSARS